MVTLNDNDKLTALTQAAILYKTRKDRGTVVVALAEWDFFTIGQLSQLSGYSTSTLYHALGITKRGYGAGRFNPMSLDTLISLLSNRINGREISPELVKIAVLEGNSHRVIQKMTGINASTISRIMKRINDNHSSGVQ